MRRRRALAVSCVAASLAVAGCRSEPEPPDPAALVEQLKSSDQGVSGAAALELIGLGAPAVPPLVELLRDPDAARRALAARTLWAIGGRAGDAATALGAALADDDVGVRVGAAMALSNMGAPAAPAVPELAQALRDPSGEVRQWAARALGNIGRAAEPALPALERAAKLDDLHGPAEEAIRRIRAR